MRPIISSPLQAEFLSKSTLVEQWIWLYETGYTDIGNCQHEQLDQIFERAYNIYELCLGFNFNVFHNFTIIIYITFDRFSKAHDICFGFIDNHIPIHLFKQILCNPPHPHPPQAVYIYHVSCPNIRLDHPT